MSTPFDTIAPAATVPATDGQLSFIASLLSERNWNDAATQPSKHISRAAVVNMLLGVVSDDDKIAAWNLGLVASSPVLGERLNQALEHAAKDAAPEMAYCWRAFGKSNATTLIDTLKALPLKDTAAKTVSSDVVVPAGRYAVATEDGATNALAFYKVDHGKGRWAGKTFVTMIVGGGNDVELGTGQSAKAALRKIAADVEGAAARYGHEIGRCGFCHTTLTNDVSRARGIGPDCAKKYL